MANRRRSTRRRRRAPIRRVARRAGPAGQIDGQTPAAPRPDSSPGRSATRLPTLPHLRRDLTISLGLGVGLTLVMVAVGLAVG